jgi:hypothetical protein
MSKRVRQDEDDDDEEEEEETPPTKRARRPTELAARLHALASGATLGIREGESTIDIDELRPRLNPKTGEFVDGNDPNRFIPTREGYVRDWRTGQVRADQIEQAPFNPAYMEERHRRLRLEDGNPDVRFFKMVSSFINEALTDYVDLEALVDTDRQREVRALALEEEKARRTRSADAVLKELAGYQKVLAEREKVLQDIRLHVEAPLARFQRAPSSFNQMEMVANADSASHMFAFPFYMRWQYREVLPSMWDTRRPLQIDAIRFILDMDDEIYLFDFSKMDDLREDTKPVLRYYQFLKQHLDAAADSETRQTLLRLGFVNYVLQRDIISREFLRLRASSAFPIISHGQHWRLIWIEYLRRGLAALPGFAPQWLSVALPSEGIGNGEDAFYLGSEDTAVNGPRMSAATRIFMPEYTKFEFLGIDRDGIGAYEFGANSDWEGALQDANINSFTGPVALALLDMWNDNLASTLNELRRDLNRSRLLFDQTLLWAFDDWQTRSTVPSDANPAFHLPRNHLQWRAHAPWLHDWEMACVALERMQSPRLLEFVEVVMPNRMNGPDKTAWTLFSLPRTIARGDTDEQRSARYRVTTQEDISETLRSGDLQDYYHYTMGYFTEPRRLLSKQELSELQALTVENREIRPDQWPLRYDIYGQGEEDGWQRATNEFDQIPLLLEPAAVDPQYAKSIAGRALFERTLPALVGGFGQTLSAELRARLPPLPPLPPVSTARWPGSRSGSETCKDDEKKMPEEMRAMMLRFLLPFDEIGAMQQNDQESSRLAILHDLYAYCGLPTLTLAAHALRIASFCPLATLAYHLDYMHQVFIDDTARRKGIDDFRASIIRIEEQLQELQAPRVSVTSATHLLRTIQETHVLSGAEISDPMIAGRIYLKPAALTLLALGSSDLLKWGWGRVRLEDVTSRPLQPGENRERANIATEFASWLAFRHMCIKLDNPDVYKTTMQRQEAVPKLQARQRQCWLMLSRFFGPPDPQGEAAGRFTEIPGYHLGARAQQQQTFTAVLSAAPSWTIKYLS